MAKAIANLELYIKGDPAQDLSGSGNAECLCTYDVVDGAAKKASHHTLASPDWSKTFHNTGAAGEFVRDAIDEIKTAEGIS